MIKLIKNILKKEEVEKKYLFPKELSIKCDHEELIRDYLEYKRRTK
jgi:hypothetical protein